MEIKVVLSAAATIIAIVSFVPYIRSMLQGKTHPHTFSWLIWTIVAYIAGFGQLAAGGGVGAWAVLTTAVLCSWVTQHAFRHGKITITKGDKINLAIALAAIPLWMITGDPMLSVMLAATTDLIAFWMTARKTYHLPYSENLTQHLMSIAKYALIILTLEQYNLTTLFYPALNGIAGIIFCSMVLFRRSKIAPPLA